MTPSDRLSGIAKQLQDGEIVQPVTVREFLSWFAAKRRGYWIVESIRRALSESSLATEPDFESEYIDSTISFNHAAKGSTNVNASVVEQIELTDGLSAEIKCSSSLTANLTVPTPYADPTYRISKLAAANNVPLTVSPDASLAEAATKMLTNGYSQLPVMTNERDVKGIISWASIGSRLALGPAGTVVRDFMEDWHEVRSDASIFQAIPSIVQNQYVLVRSHDKKISGIVTASDLSLQFQQLSEPFLLLSEIENQIRRLLDNKFSAEDFVSAKDPNASERHVLSVADLAFGEYIRLLEHPTQWEKLGTKIDRATFCFQLDRVRVIRNDVMHFDPDGISPDDLEALREFAKFLRHMQLLGLA